jgi:uncharacterized damage-inducible protein DinB
MTTSSGVSAGGIERIGPSSTADERRTLREFLDFHRATLALKCDGLTDEQLHRRACPPSTLSLLGLLRHMAEVERTWFRIVFAGESELPLVWSDSMDYQAAYEPGDCTWQEAFAAWQAEVGHARRIEREAASLDVTVHAERWGEDVSLRHILNHLVHEYARHNGHADLLREAVDGTVGV